MTLPSVYSSISAHTHAVDFLMLHLQGEGFVIGFLRIRACRPLTDRPPAAWRAPFGGLESSKTYKSSLF